MKRTVSSENAYPLHWPDGQKRRRRRLRAQFEARFSSARDHLINELKLLGARWVVLSTNVPVRQDGLPYAGMRQPEDPAVAVYFDYDKEQHVFACDKWDKVQDNIRALGKTIEALRGIARWGSTDMMKRAVNAFKALPPSGDDWRAVLGVPKNAPNGTSLEFVKLRYRGLAADAHPDHGGNPHEMARINQAWEAAQKELGEPDRLSDIGHRGAQP